MTYDQWKTESGYSERDPIAGPEGCVCQHVGYCTNSSFVFFVLRPSLPEGNE